MTQSRYEDVQHLDGDRLRAYLSDRRLGQALHDGLASVVDLYRRLNAIEAEDATNESERESLYESQNQARQNLGALATSGDEGKLRKRYVQSLEASEDRLAAIDRGNTKSASERTQLELRIATMLDALAEKSTGK